MVDCGYQIMVHFAANSVEANYTYVAISDTLLNLLVTINFCTT